MSNRQEKSSLLSIITVDVVVVVEVDDEVTVSPSVLIDFVADVVETVCFTMPSISPGIVGSIEGTAIEGPVGFNE